MRRIDRRPLLGLALKLAGLMLLLVPLLVASGVLFVAILAWDVGVPWQSVWLAGVALDAVALLLALKWAACGRRRR